MPTVCVFAASSRKIDPRIGTLTRSLGRSLASAGWDLVFGGANIGLMNDIASGFRDEKARIFSVIPEIFAGDLTFEDSTEVVVTPDLRQRKDEMDRRADAFLTLPGGLGTLDETCEILVLKQIGLCRKPLILWNHEGHYDPFLKLIAGFEERGFCSSETDTLFQVAGTIDEVLEAFQARAT